MAQAVIMPKPGQTMEEATIVKWHKQAGDAVNKGDVLFEIETDKAVLEVESFFEGTLLKILVGENVTAPVQSVVAYIGAKGEAVPDAPPPPPAAPAAAAPVAAPAPAAPAPSPAAPRAAATAAPAPAAPTVAPTPQPAARLFISPRAKALAEARCIDPTPIRGSGPNGRIVTKDVEAYLAAHHYDQLRISPAAKQIAAKEKLDILTVRGTGVGGRIMVQDVQRHLDMRPRRMSKMRQIIASRLTQSFTTTPHFYVTVSTDMTALLAYRKELKDRGVAYKVTDFILEATVLALQEFPIVNSVAEGTTVRWHGGVNLGVAVSLDDGLVVPVVRDAQDLSLRELADATAAFAQKARDGKLLPDEMKGSSFTVSNMGMLDVENFLAIINPGEGGILAVSSTIETPVVRDGKVAIRSIMKITASVDHRIVDGSVAAQFVNAIKNNLEDVELWKRLT